LQAKCVMVSGTRRLAPVHGAGNRRQKLANVSSTLVAFALYVVKVKKTFNKIKIIEVLQFNSYNNH